MASRTTPKGRVHLRSRLELTGLARESRRMASPATPGKHLRETPLATTSKTGKRGHYLLLKIPQRSCPVSSHAPQLEG